MAAGASAVQRLLRITALNAVPAAYDPILRLQELLFEQRRQGLIPDTLLQLEVTPCRRHSSCPLAALLPSG